MRENSSRVELSAPAAHIIKNRKKWRMCCRRWSLWSSRWWFSISAAIRHGADERGEGETGDRPRRGNSRREKLKNWWEANSLSPSASAQDIPYSRYKHQHTQWSTTRILLSYVYMVFSQWMSRCHMLIGISCVQTWRHDIDYLCSRTVKGVWERKSVFIQILGNNIVHCTFYRII